MQKIFRSEFTNVAITFFSIAVVVPSVIFTVIPHFDKLFIEDYELELTAVSFLFTYVYLLIIIGVYVVREENKKKDFNQLFFSYDSNKFEKEVTRLFKNCERSLHYFGASNFMKKKGYRRALKRIMDNDLIEYKRYADILTTGNLGKILERSHKKEPDDDSSKGHNLEVEELIKSYTRWINDYYKKEPGDDFSKGHNLEVEELIKSYTKWINDNYKNKSNNGCSKEYDPEIEELIKSYTTWIGEQINFLSERESTDPDSKNNFIVNLRVAPSWKWGVHVIVVDDRDTIFSFNDGEGNIGMILKNNDFFATAVRKSFMKMLKNYTLTKDKEDDESVSDIKVTEKVLDKKICKNHKKYIQVKQ